MHNNVDLISETYEDTTTGKLQIRRFQPPHSSLMSSSRKALEYLQFVYIAKN